MYSRQLLTQGISIIIIVYIPTVISLCSLNKWTSKIKFFLDCLNGATLKQSRCSSTKRCKPQHGRSSSQSMDRRVTLKPGLNLFCPSLLIQLVYSQHTILQTFKAKTYLRLYPWSISLSLNGFGPAMKSLVFYTKISEFKMTRLKTSYVSWKMYVMWLMSHFVKVVVYWFIVALESVDLGQLFWDTVGLSSVWFRSHFQLTLC